MFHYPQHILTLLVFSGIISVFLSCSPPSRNGLAAEYRLNTNLNDYVKASLARNAGEVRFVKTPFRYGMRIMPGDSTAFVEFPCPASVSGDFSVGFWVRFSSLSRDQVLLSYHPETDIEKPPVFLCGLTPPYWYVESEPGKRDTLGKFPVHTGEFYHLFWTSKGGKGVFYINASRVGEFHSAPLSGTMVIPGAGKGGMLPTDCTVDEVCIYDKYFQAAQVDSVFQHYNDITK